ncbi:hypothetical protein HBH98_142920 [Parastagonospora nodorum]|nr:hypothetical protein HBH52_082730 [Parastagonospora nodorum]KAH4344030.1 hypothetical protein HBH98_142920 [Parastagonospora nodorum]KAH4372221.1 hypothetical protein HBH97_135300 [Parastagonospora nodorum]KAH4376545.1 hypothetical protein HBH99_212130 [Parastagonospora nodorum]KAH5048644.1 hypothetical protein HBH96_209270 [Parastagonospora nodorum]
MDPAYTAEYVSLAHVAPKQETHHLDQMPTDLISPAPNQCSEESCQHERNFSAPPVPLSMDVVASCEDWACSERPREASDRASRHVNLTLRLPTVDTNAAVALPKGIVIEPMKKSDPSDGARVRQAPSFGGSEDARVSQAMGVSCYMKTLMSTYIRGG